MRDAGLSRRRLLQGAAAAGAVLWTRAYRIPAAVAEGSGPPNFPSGIEVYRQAFENWAGEIVVDDLWTCSPATGQEVVTLANWAHDSGYRLRPRGAMHGWSPLSVMPGATSKTVMVDTTAHLTMMSFAMSDGGLPTVTAQAGVLMDDLLAEMEARGYGFLATPAPGDITVGGALAIDGHGTGVPAAGEHRGPGPSLHRRLSSGRGPRCRG